MSDISVKHSKRYVDHTKDISKQTSLIRGSGNSSDRCKALGDFGFEYSKNRPTKDRENDTKTEKKFNRQQDNNDIINHAMDEIILQENNKVSD